MINVKMIQKCAKCNEIAIIHKVYIKEENDEKYFVKEYKCDYGHITTYKEVINFIF